MSRKKKKINSQFTPSLIGAGMSGLLVALRLHNTMCTTDELNNNIKGLDARLKSIEGNLHNSLSTVILEHVNDIIESTAKRIQHNMSPETQQKFDKIENDMKKNNEEHALILYKLKEMQDSYGEHKALLEEIKKDIIARGWIRKFLSDWWLVIGIFFSALTLYIKSLIK